MIEKVVATNLLHGKEIISGIDLWHRQEQEFQKNLLQQSIIMDEALTTLDG